MTASNFSTSIVVNNSPEEVFTAINNVSAWWQGEINGPTTQLNDEFDYRMKGHHYSRQKVVELIPNEKIVWEVIDSDLNGFKNTAEWTGTKIVFEISRKNNQTVVHFTHLGLTNQFECYGGCSWAWGELIQESLLSYIRTGKGTNVFG
jgi:uncharacterized protein YndB with AHSA1/START domain